MVTRRPGGPNFGVQNMESMNLLRGPSGQNRQRGRIASALAWALQCLSLVLLAGLLAYPIESSANSQQSNDDSASLNGAAALPGTNCPNIQTQWYGPGLTPAGYYKSNLDGNCYPIPACPGNQTWQAGPQVCGCTLPLIWDAPWATCHLPCVGGTAWDGTTCANICTGGRVWDGSQCVCTGGRVFNGSTCGFAPAFGNFSVGPNAVLIGSGNYTVNWGITGDGPLSATLSCSGANTAAYALVPPAGGSGALAATAQGVTNCQATASNAWGVTNSTIVSVSANCPGGTTWNGTTCQSVCTGGRTWDGFQCVCPISGQTWDGSACVCPMGQVANATSCGFPPAFGTFTITPPNVTVGTSDHTVNWAITGSGTITATINCTGDNPMSGSLVPAASGSGVLPAPNAGNTTCIATATNAWGTTNSAPVAVTASCHPSTTRVANACVCSVTGAVWTGTQCECTGGQVSNGTSCGFAPTFTNFSMTPPVLEIGSGGYTVNWATTGTSNTVTLNCSGANSGSTGLVPPAGGTVSVFGTGTKFGASTCQATASNPWGMANSPAVIVNAQCPPIKQWVAATQTCEFAPATQADLEMGLGIADDCASTFTWVDNGNGTVTITFTYNRQWMTGPAGMRLDTAKRDANWNGTAWVWSGPAYAPTYVMTPANAIAQCW